MNREKNTFQDEYFNIFRCYVCRRNFVAYRLRKETYWEEENLSKTQWNNLNT